MSPIGSIWACLAMLGLLSGCSGDDSSPASGGDDAGTSAGGGDSETALHGYFNVKIIPALPETLLRPAMGARTSVEGRIADLPQPEAKVWKVTDEAGDCTLLTPDPPFCDPACGGVALCVAGGSCAPVPTRLSAGNVRVEGLGEAFDLTDAVPGQYATLATLPYPPCAEGDPIHLEVTRGPYAPFTLDAACVAEMDLEDAVTLERGTPFALRWTAPAMPELARVLVELDLSSHGGTRGEIECDVADTGSLDIPATLVDALLDLGIAGFPSVVVTRAVKAPGSTEQARGVVLTVSSRDERIVTIPGITSCTDDTHCPTPETCQPDLKCGP